MVRNTVSRLATPAALAAVIALTISMAAGPASGGGCPAGNDLMIVGSRAFLRSEAGLERYPNETAACGSCHDGTVGRPFTASTGGRGFNATVRAELTATSHPVDIVYPASDPEFVSPSELDPRIELVAGQVTCTTCHRVAEDGRMELSLTLQRSRLCRACHLK